MCAHIILIVELGELWLDDLKIHESWYTYKKLQMKTSMCLSSSWVPSLLFPNQWETKDFLVFVLDLNEQVSSEHKGILNLPGNIFLCAI